MESIAGGVGLLGCMVMVSGQEAFLSDHTRSSCSKMWETYPLSKAAWGSCGRVFRPLPAIELVQEGIIVGCKL